MLMHGIQSAIDELYERVLALEEGGGGEGAVKGVKGAVETAYRKGNVNLTLPNIANLSGGLTYDDDTKTIVGTQTDSMPAASAGNAGKIVQYTGAETADFKPGMFYTCEEDPDHPGTYKWNPTQVGEADPDALTHEEMEALLALLGY